jgi:hypothetical protein
MADRIAAGALLALFGNWTGALPRLVRRAAKARQLVLEGLFDAPGVLKPSAGFSRLGAVLPRKQRHRRSLARPVR